MEHHQVEVQDQETAAGSRTHSQFPTVAAGYEILTQIGASDHSKVYKAVCKSVNSSIVAVKVIDIDIKIDPISIKNTNSMSLMNHPNILSPHCCFTADDGRFWIVMPFIRAGSLQAVLSENFPTGFPFLFISILLNQLLRGLFSLHEMGFVHNSVKPSNIFFDSQGSVRLSDLNLCNNRADDGSDETLPYWTPPEQEESSFKSDIWSVGVLAMEIAYGHPPISGSEIIKSQLLNISKRFPYDLNMAKKMDKSPMDRKFEAALKHFVNCCLVKNQSERHSAGSLLDHPFVKRGEVSNKFFEHIPKAISKEIGDRFEEHKDRIMGLMKKDEDLIQQQEEDKKISGWDYNAFVFELKPDEKSVEKRVRFAVETRNTYAELDRDQEETEFDSSSLIQQTSDSGSEENNDVEVMDKRDLITLSILTSLLNSVDHQREMIKKLITQFGLSHNYEA